MKPIQYSYLPPIAACGNILSSNSNLKRHMKTCDGKSKKAAMLGMVENQTNMIKTLSDEISQLKRKSNMYKLKKKHNL